MMVQAAEGQDRGDAKRARTIGGLEVNVLEVQYEYAGLDGQPLPPETIEVMAVDVPGYDTDVVPEAAVYDARTGASLPLHLVRAGRTKEVESMGRHDVYEEKPEAQCQGRRVRAKWLDDKWTDPVTGEEITQPMRGHGGEHLRARGRQCVYAAAHRCAAHRQLGRQ